ncbi:MAG: 30S ribosomal protein S18 [Gemmatimonadetes bacterium]|nr:30S ribosomal protein S18 [Gemmatimonadota bacterium]MYK65138.1 30S ribosomal protein S18 [Gemmatimonadota bacterium]
MGVPVKMRPYEIVYVLDSALEREAVDEKLDSFHSVLGGEITVVDHWGVRQLAYPIRKSKTAYYVIVQVTTDPDALPEFERLLRLDEETMRYLIVLNEGQPTSGASVLADRPVLRAAEEPEDDAPAAEAEAEGEGGDGAGEDEDQEEGEAGEDGKADDADAPPQSSGPPEFSGARGRRRRHEGPPIVLLNYKDVTTLARFLTEQGKILPKRTTKVTARFQRQLGTAVKRARFLALLPYIRDHEG